MLIEVPSTAKINRLKKVLELEISRCHLADYVKELDLSACRTRSTIIFPHSTNQIIGFWRRCCRWLELPSAYLHTAAFSFIPTETHITSDTMFYTFNLSSTAFLSEYRRFGPILITSTKISNFGKPKPATDARGKAGGCERSFKRMQDKPYHVHHVIMDFFAHFHIGFVFFSILCLKKKRKK